MIIWAVLYVNWILSDFVNDHLSDKARVAAFKADQLMLVNFEIGIDTIGIRAWNGFEPLPGTPLTYESCSFLNDLP